jgi:predicted nucleic acid-binding protein
VIYADTSVWIDYIAGRNTRETAWLDALVGANRITMGDLILTEVLQGIRGDAQFARVRRELEQLDVHPMAGARIAVQAAQNYRLLRGRGVTVRGTVDCLIATYCIDGSHQLLHSDRDYKPFEEHLGLQSYRR